jgi:hypothetical protein
MFLIVPVNPVEPILTGTVYIACPVVLFRTVPVSVATLFESVPGPDPELLLPPPSHPVTTSVGQPGRCRACRIMTFSFLGFVDPADRAAWPDHVGA